MILKIVDDDRQTCVIVTRKDLSCCHHPWGDDCGGASFVDYSVWTASDTVYPKPEKNHDNCGLSKIIYELLLDKMSLSSTIFCDAPIPNMTFV